MLVEPFGGGGVARAGDGTGEGVLRKRGSYE